VLLTAGAASMAGQLAVRSTQFGEVEWIASIFLAC